MTGSRTVDDKALTLDDLLREGAEILSRAQVPDGELDARRLLLEAFHMEQVHFLMERMKPAEEPEARNAYRQMIRRRAEREPLQYILGRQEFMGLEFEVNRHVLIPRQDTETLVELVLKEQQDKRKTVVDLCTGSGCIAISLAAIGGYASVTATDLSPEALKVAERNAGKLLKDRQENRSSHGRFARSRFTLRQGDLFDALEPGAKYDILVSNPPYIPENVIGGLQPEVRDYEPVLALNGSADGLEFYRRIAEEGKQWLNPGGAVYLEIGFDQGEAVSSLLISHGFQNIEVFKDLPGHDRVVRAWA